jgi:hypothetical protein
MASAEGKYSTLLSRRKGSRIAAGFRWMRAVHGNTHAKRTAIAVVLAFASRALNLVLGRWLMWCSASVDRSCCLLGSSSVVSLRPGLHQPTVAHATPRIHRRCHSSSVPFIVELVGACSNLSWLIGRYEDPVPSQGGAG